MSNELVEQVQNMPNETITIIKSKIISLPNRPPCILAQDVADIFVTQTKYLNQAVKRNAVKFGEKYCFKITSEEYQNLKSQIVTSSFHGGRRRIPWAFTQYGVIMLATVLNMPRAIEACKLIVDAFVAMLNGQAVSSISSKPEKMLISKDSIIRGQADDLAIMRDLIRYQRNEISRLKVANAEKSL